MRRLHMKRSESKRQIKGGERFNIGYAAEFRARLIGRKHFLYRNTCDNTRGQRIKCNTALAAFR